jgi:phenylpropionate dioxygenase-like ring-hydroxylating dioxygenase large terminal subunit
LAKVNEYQNNTGQKKHTVFNNWDSITLGWYIACRSKEIRHGQVKSFDICGKRIAVFRSESGKLGAIEGYCRHMGVDLGIGKVIGENLRCYFHHWKYDRKGQCIDIPCQKTIPSKAKLYSFDLCEKYGFIWIYPETKSPLPILEVPELSGVDIRFSHGRPYHRKCHHHITMINGIDPQHLSTVHNIHMNMDIKITEENQSEIDIELKGETPKTRLTEKIIRRLLGPNYCYSMKYQNACLASLSVMKGVKLFGKYSIFPTMHMLFAYQTIEKGNTKVWPIFLTKKRTFFLGWMIDYLLLFFTRMAFRTLQGEDGEVYENINFQTDCLLPIDKPVAKYIHYVNQLPLSRWSKDNDAHS